MTCLKLWRLVEDAKWSSLPSLGTEWMVKTCASEGEGYQVMVTDGCGLWGERRKAGYVSDKAEDWIPCIEGGVQEISSLVLSELSRKDVTVLWSGDRQRVDLTVNSKLNDFFYRWEFELNRLPDELFKHHWVTPMFVQTYHLGLKVKQLTTEINQKQRQLDELLPDTKSLSKNSKTTKSKDNLLERATEGVHTSGPWAALQDHLSLYPDIMKHLTTLQSQKFEETISEPKKRKTAVVLSPVDVETEAEMEEKEAEEERKRRAKIQEITQGGSGSVTHTKKKKKLKI